MPADDSRVVMIDANSNKVLKTVCKTKVEAIGISANDSPLIDHSHNQSNEDSQAADDSTLFNDEEELATMSDSDSTLTASDDELEILRSRKVLPQSVKKITIIKADGSETSIDTEFQTIVLSLNKDKDKLTITLKAKQTAHEEDITIKTEPIDITIVKLEPVDLEPCETEVFYDNENTEHNITESFNEPEPEIDIELRKQQDAGLLQVFNMRDCFVELGGDFPMKKLSFKLVCSLAFSNDAADGLTIKCTKCSKFVKTLLNVDQMRLDWHQHVDDFHAEEQKWIGFCMTCRSYVKKFQNHKDPAMKSMKSELEHVFDCHNK
jgi:hypothetical protein